MVHRVQHRQVGNWILDTLPQDEYDLLEMHLQQVELAQNEVLCHSWEPITQVYFPTTALLSWTHSTLEGEIVEIGITGYEGLMGTTFLFDRDIVPWQVQVQLPGVALKLSAEEFTNRLHKFPVLRQKTMAFVYLKLVHLTQSALCNRFHSVEQRLCRWLLEAQDRVKTPELSLTREILATMIGARRPAVSIVTGTLKSAGLIRTARGIITIVNREEMEEATCECYYIFKQEFDLYLEG